MSLVNYHLQSIKTFNTYSNVKYKEFYWNCRMNIGKKGKIFINRQKQREKLL